MRPAPLRHGHQRDIGIDVGLAVRDVLQGPARGIRAPVLSARLPVRQYLRQPAPQVCRPHVTEGWEHDRHQAVVDPVVVGQQRGEHPVREAHRIGLGFHCNHPEVLAGQAEYVPDRAGAVVHAVEHRLSEVQEAPHQIQRQVGADGRNPVRDHRPLLVEVTHELAPLLPVDEGPCGPQGRDALADLGGDAVAALLCGEFQAQATLHLGIAVRELDEDHSQALWAERHQVVQGDGLPRRGHMVSGSRAPRTAGR